MPNYGIIANVMFCRSYSKNERFPARKKRKKIAIAAVSVAIDFLGHDKRLSK